MNTETNDYVVLKGHVEEIKVPKDNPFENDKLQRSCDVTRLTKIVESYQNGASIVLDGAWGTGKTTFVKFWKQTLENNGFPVVYYNAWEDDLSEEPLFSMIRGLRSISNDDSSYDNFVEKAGKFIAGALFGAVKGATGFWGDTISGAVKGGVEQLEKDCINSLKSKDTTTTLLKAFKDALIDYLSSCEKKCPLVYFVDELDRCNPTFAVKVLERIKHLFEVPNVVFVLSIDKQQLAYSINGYFGSDKFDSMEYLRRFIDIEYTFKSPVADYSFFLCETYGIFEFVRERCPDGERFLRAILKWYYFSYTNLRQLEKVFLLVQYALSGARYDEIDESHNNKLLVPAYIILANFKICNSICYQKILNGSYSLQELVDELESHMPSMEDNESEMEEISLCMLTILSCYYSYSNLQIKTPIIDGDDDDNDTFIQLSKLNYNKINNVLIHKYKRHIETYTFNLASCLFRLELLWF